MPSDYQAITADNIRRRGEEFDDIGRLISEQFYSDQTHFVYELLQNAEDALRRRHIVQPGLGLPNSVTFRLYSDRLEISHFGQPFNLDDVIGISDILRGTKGDDPKQIGKFGIGFKSVYAFTATPEIHSGDEHFRIERYIRPHAAASRKTRPEETLFIIPFNHHKTTAKTAFSRIKERLSDLGIRTLLFLSSIDQVIWEVDGVEQGRYKRDCVHLSSISRRVILQGERGKKTEREQWMLFERPVDRPHVKGGTKVEIAFLLQADSKTKIETVTPVSPSHLYVYFPTAKETHLRFLIQGYYNTTPSRDNILINDPWNEILIRETAQLVVDALVHFRDEGKINLSLLQTMPIHSGEFPKDSFFRPIFDEVRKAFQERPLLPASDGSYVTSGKAKLSRTSELRQLLSMDVLPDLFGTGVAFSWLSDEITIDRAPELRTYLMDDLKVEEVDPEKFAGKVALHFLQSRSDDWMAQFYGYLDGQKALWRPRETYYRQGVLREKPFIRLEDGRHVPPFDSKGLPNAYLPPEEQTDFPTVRRTIAQKPEALKFLKNLGLQKPDLVDEVINKILPKYKVDRVDKFEVADHLIDIRKIVKGYSTSFGDRKISLLQLLQEVSFLQAINAQTLKREFKKPQQIYFRDEELDLFLGGNPDIWFLDYIYPQYRDTLHQIGVKDRIQIFARRSNSQGYVILVDYSGRHVRGVAGFDDDASIHGLDWAVERPTLERSQFVWNKLLVPFSQLIQGTVQTSSRQAFDGNIWSEETVSPLGQLVINNAWLPNKAGEFHLPSELSLDDLSEDFIKDEKLARQLNMKASSLRILAEDEGVDETDLALIIQALKNNPEAIRNLATEISKVAYSGDDSEEVEEEVPFSYHNLLTETFSRPGKDTEPGDIDDPFSEGEVNNPEMRRERVEKEIQTDINLEPSRETRFKKVATNIWEAKDNQVREFLREQYYGKCQICGITFKKRDGEPYFEGLYLVSHTQKQWIDRPGNVLCLCANCCAKFQHGAVEADDIDEQILRYKTYREGGKEEPALLISLCDEPVIIQFTEKHLLDLQEILKVSTG
jgi:hypothetical protein